jgi:hypothetical protein
MKNGKYFGREKDVEQNKDGTEKQNMKDKI